MSGVPEDRPGVAGGYVPRVPAEWLSRLPEGCDAWAFLAGLYERSGLWELAAYPPSLLCMQGRTVPLREACWKLAGLDMSLTV